MKRPNPVELWEQVVLPALVKLGPEVAYPGVEWAHRQGRQWRAACPLHAGESTTSFVVDLGTLRWQCFGGCGGGNPLSFAAGGELPKGPEFTAAVRELAELAGVDWPEDEAAAAALPRQPLPPPRPAQPPRYPPVDEVAELWARARPVDADRDAVAWLRSRRLAPDLVVARDLARALAPGARCPSWARFWGPWSSGPYRLLVPLWDAQGRLRSIHARAVTSTEADRPKAVSTSALDPADRDGTRTSCRGLVFADALGREVLERGEPPSWWPLGRPLRVVVCEGEPDYLTWATRWAEGDEAAPAVLGIVGGGRSGSWREDLGLRLPRGSTVIVRTDSDPAGDQYARSIARTLGDGCRVLRRRDRGEAA